MKRLPLLLLFATTALAAPWVNEEPKAGDFPLVQDGQAAAIVFSPEDFEVVHIATRDLAADIERVTGLKPAVTAKPAGPAVLVGTVGHSPLIDGLVAAGKLDVKDLRDAWESFVITTVTNPLPGVPSALVIVGSDRRGTAFGVYELSQAIGVSPWYWWADVTPAKKSALFVAGDTRRFGPPSVQYRGIFLNDEDWGLQPWAAKTFEPEAGDIGPKTYAKICELLLRLKANTLWPAMHPSTKAFNLFPQNKVVADNYAIVMGSSHAEPMLRNNVTEWTAPHEAYNYLTNREGVRKYWEQRVRENGRYENIYTLGMRGIHDSNMQGPKTDAERIRTLEQIFADQRAMLARHVNPKVEQVPQMFCAYKEVLALYQQGLKVPDDVTIVWPDDNFGYIRNFASAEELKRSGGFGVYYHISYLGAPLSYLWLSTTPPGLIWEEMRKAWDHGARKIWIVNVGDLKPAEIGTEFFLQMAWDIDRWNGDNLKSVLPQWAEREFGRDQAPEIAHGLDLYYELNYRRRPEHLQWWLRSEAPRPSAFSRAEIDARLDIAARLQAAADRIAARLPADRQDAFEELVGYPLRGAALANQRYFYDELGQPDKALAADAALKEATRRYNEEIAGGKWRGMMTLEPGDQQFKSMRIQPWKPQLLGPKVAPDRAPFIAVPVPDFQARTDRGAAGWRGTGIGYAVLPSTTPPVPLERVVTDAPRLDYAVNFPAAGDWNLTVYLIPTHPLEAGHGLRLAASLDEAPPALFAYTGKDGSAEWEQGVLNNHVTATLALKVPAPGKHMVRLYGVDAGVVLTRAFELSPVVRTLPIARDAWSASSINVLANQNHTLLTAGGVQYAAFYGADKSLVLARRPLGTDKWETQRTPYTGNVADAHHTIALGVDGAGYLHVAWDHHDNPLNYARSVHPGSLVLGPKQSMVGSLEEHVTYPMFFRQPDGGLLFLYRDGQSGRGNVVLNRYEVPSAAFPPRVGGWRRVHDNLIDGENARSAYLAATVDPKGTLHLAWNWRDSPDVATNHDLCYAKSADGGVSWTSSIGGKLPVPLTAANAEYALWIPANSRLMNPPSLTTDAAGHPFIASYWTPPGSNVPQFQVVHHDGKSWSLTQVSARTKPFDLSGGGTKHPPISRAAILARQSPAGPTEFHLIFRDDERGGRIVALSTDDLAQPVWRTRELTANSVGAWEPSLDPVQWTQFGQVHLLLQKVEQQDGNDHTSKLTVPTPISSLIWRP